MPAAQLPIRMFLNPIGGKALAEDQARRPAAALEGLRLGSADDWA